MPANLTPQYKAAEERYRAATDPEEKLAALREMLAVMPKHKGTEKLQGDLKQRIAKLTQQAQSRGGARRTTFDHVPREGAGQVVLIGPPNAGKSSLLGALTRAEPVIAPYPFTTHVPQPGMMPFEDVMVQLVDTPALAAEHTPPWLPGLVRSADLALLVVDLSSPALLEEVEFALDRMAQSRVHLRPPGDGSPPEDPSAEAVQAVVVGTHAELEDATMGRDLLGEFLAGGLPFTTVSTVDRRGLEELRSRVYALLDVIRVYTKEPGKPADRERPFVLKRGSTVGDLAALIHKDLAAKLRFARVWGTATFDGQTVHRDHPLSDRDIVELHE